MTSTIDLEPYRVTHRVASTVIRLDATSGAVERDGLRIRWEQISDDGFHVAVRIDGEPITVGRVHLVEDDADRQPVVQPLNIHGEAFIRSRPIGWLVIERIAPSDSTICGLPTPHPRRFAAAALATAEPVLRDLEALATTRVWSTILARQVHDATLGTFRRAGLARRLESHLLAGQAEGRDGDIDDIWGSLEHVAGQSDLDPAHHRWAVATLARLQLVARHPDPGRAQAVRDTITAARSEEDDEVRFEVERASRTARQRSAFAYPGDTGVYVLVDRDPSDSRSTLPQLALIADKPSRPTTTDELWLVPLVAGTSEGADRFGDQYNYVGHLDSTPPDSALTSEGYRAVDVLIRLAALPITLAACLPRSISSAAPFTRDAWRELAARPETPTDLSNVINRALNSAGTAPSDA